MVLFVTSQEHHQYESAAARSQQSVKADRPDTGLIAEQGETGRRG
jgi:hypothetical protein